MNGQVTNLEEHTDSGAVEDSGRVQASRTSPRQAARLGNQKIRLLRYLVDPRSTAIDIAQGIYAFSLSLVSLHFLLFNEMRFWY
jgi:hypothetical protein